MELIALLIICFLIYIYFKNSASESPRKNISGNQHLSHKASHVQTSKVQRFLTPIPKGYQIYVGASVSGVTYRKLDTLQFATGNQQELLLERDINNQHDKNAIKVIGILGSKKYFVGFVPKEIANQIVSTDLYDLVKPRLRAIFQGSNQYIEIDFEVLGPQSSKEQYDDFINNKPADNAQKEFYKYFNIAIPKGLTNLHANLFIKEQTKKLELEDSKKLEDYDNYIQILEEFEDVQFTEIYEIKKPKRELIIKALDMLLKQGHTYQSLSVEIDKVVDKIKELQPDLDKS